MTNNLEDFDQQGEHGNGLPPPRTGVRANLSEAWRTRPLFKLFVLMALVGAVIALSITVFSGGTALEPSRFIRPPKGLTQPPGGPSSPYFIEQTNKASENREEAAINSGGSAMPTPIGSPNNLDETSPDKKAKDPLIELRAETEHLKQQLAQVEQRQQQQAPRAPEQFDDTLARAMQKEMEKLMEGWEPHGVKDVAIVKAEDLEKEKDKKASDAQAGQSIPPVPEAKTVVPAGTVSYAELLTEANSDVPGPILAQIVSGPLAGARAVGTFKVTSDPYLVLTFTLADLKGKDYAIDALALDPDTTLGGMATDVDERWTTRILLPAAAGFLQGFGSALSQGSSSVVTNGTTTIVQQSGKGISQGAFQGAAQAGQTLSQFFQNQANNVQPLVRVAAGTPMGLFFITSVKDQSPNQQPYPYGVAQPGAPGYPNGYQNGYPNSGYPGYGPPPLNNYYPGMTMAGYNTLPPTGTVPPAANANTPYPYSPTPYNTNAIPSMNYNPLPNGSSLGPTPNSYIGPTIITH